MLPVRLPTDSLETLVETGINVFTIRQFEEEGVIMTLMKNF